MNKMEQNTLLSKQDSSGFIRKCCQKGEVELKGGKVTMKDMSHEMAEIFGGNKTHLGKTMRQSIENEDLL